MGKKTEKSATKKIALKNRKRKKKNPVEANVENTGGDLIETKSDDSEKNEDNKQKRAKKQKNYYFDNATVEKKIVEYQNGGFKDITLLNEIIIDLDKIILAIINKYHYYKYYDLDDLIQEGRMACLESLKRFNVEMAPQREKSVFSYFSHVVKRYLCFFTLNKNKKLSKEIKYENSELLNNQDAVHGKYDVDEFITSTIEMDMFFKKLRKMFENKKRMLTLAYILEKYIVEVAGNDFKIRDFFAYGKGYGFTVEYQKKFFNIIRENKEKLTGLCFITKEDGDGEKDER